MFCIFCGTANPDNAKYCHKCGRNISGFQSASRVWPPAEDTERPVRQTPPNGEVVRAPRSDLPDRYMDEKKQLAPPPVESAHREASLPVASEKPAAPPQPLEPLFAGSAEPAHTSSEMPQRPMRAAPEPPELSREAPTTPPPQSPHSWPPSSTPEGEDKVDYPGYPDEMSQEEDYSGRGDGWDEDEDVQIRREGFLKRILKKKEFRIALIGIVVCILVILLALNNLLHFIRF